MIIKHSDTLKIYPGAGAWHFVVVPLELVPANTQRGGWGSVKIRVTAGSTHWDTSMFYSKQMNGYFLPIKKQIRIAENIVPCDRITLVIKIL